MTAAPLYGCRWQFPYQSLGLGPRSWGRASGTATGVVLAALAGAGGKEVPETMTAPAV
jgi:hypothetical protein